MLVEGMRRAAKGAIPLLERQMIWRAERWLLCDGAPPRPARRARGCRLRPVIPTDNAAKLHAAAAPRPLGEQMMREQH